MLFFIGKQRSLESSGWQAGRGHAYLRGDYFAWFLGLHWAILLCILLGSLSSFGGFLQSSNINLMTVMQILSFSSDFNSDFLHETCPNPFLENFQVLTSLAFSERSVRSSPFASWIQWNYKYHSGAIRDGTQAEINVGEVLEVLCIMKKTIEHSVSYHGEAQSCLSDEHDFSQN